jgi:ElaB/YqjD/DUF883 family membrane-anchored ribosome-binding protein
MANKKNALETMKSQVVSKLEESRKQAEKEMAKVKQHVAASIKKVDDYVKKNPEKAAVISAGIGAALGAAIALLVGSKKGGKKK